VREVRAVLTYLYRFRRQSFNTAQVAYALAKWRGCGYSNLFGEYRGGHDRTEDYQSRTLSLSIRLSNLLFHLPGILTALSWRVQFSARLCVHTVSEHYRGPGVFQHLAP